MNLIIIVRKRKKKKKKKEDNREEAYRSEERGRRDDCGLRLADSPISIHPFFFFGGSLQIPFPHTISLSSLKMTPVSFSQFSTRTGTSKRRRSTPRPKFLNI